MHVDPLERRWIAVSLVLMLTITGVLLGYAIAGNVHPPSNVETIDSNRLHLTPEFAEDNLGVATNPDGTLTVTMGGVRYGFYPQHGQVSAAAVGLIPPWGAAIGMSASSLLVIANTLRLSKVTSCPADDGAPLRQPISAHG